MANPPLRPVNDIEERIMTFKIFIFSALMAAFVGVGYAQSGSYNFDNDAVDKPPAGFTSYATGGGPPGKWLVREMADARSEKHVVVQTDSDSTDTRFPVLIADKGECSDLDASDAFNVLNHVNYVSFIGKLSSPFFEK